MSQHNLHHHHAFLHYTPPGQTAAQATTNGQQQQPQQLNITHVAPKDTQRQPTIIQHQPPQQVQQVAVQPVASTSASASTGASTSGGTGPVVARGDWTKDLVQLAKNAELKKHALTLQLHMAHILSAHANLEQKGRAIQDLKEQKNKLESERTRLLTCLRQINEDRDKVDMLEASLLKECTDTEAKIQQLTETDYAVAKADVDRLRAELGMPALPSLQKTLEDKSSQYLADRLKKGSASQSGSGSTPASTSSPAPTSTPTSTKRSAPTSSGADLVEGSQAKRPRGRPKGSKNKTKAGDS